MKRDTSALTTKEFDVVVIGGGINGVACALDAALRGLSVAVLERDDFGSHTSSNSAKIAHSGLRYLQHADFARMRESIRERNLLIKNAPHLVGSQPVLFPVYGHGIKGREVMTVYLKIYDLLSQERKDFEDPARRIPDSFLISKQEVLGLAPGVSDENLTGGAVWYEGQIHNTERLLMSLIHTAHSHGARLANYTEVTRVNVDDGHVSGVEAIDKQSGASLTVRGKVVLNASGPWINKTVELTGRTLSTPLVRGSKAFSLLTRSLCDTHALSFGIRPMYEDKKAVVNKGASIQFAIPWRGHSLIGSLHLPADDDPSNVGISEQEIRTYIDLINQGYPTARLTRDDVKHVLWGMVPAEEAGSAAPAKHYKILDHAAEDALNGFISIAGVKLTTSRDVAEKTIDLVCRKLGRPEPSITGRTPLWGGDIRFMAEFQSTSMAKLTRLPKAVAERLLRTYGTQHTAVLDAAAGRPELLQPIPDSDVLRVEIVHAVRAEMALTLKDVVLRRTDLGSLQFPGYDALGACTEIMATELMWDERRVAAEIEGVAAIFAGRSGRTHVQDGAA